MRSLGGGAGSGFGEEILTFMNEEAPKVPLLEVPLWPSTPVASQGASQTASRTASYTASCLEPYNALLSLRGVVERKGGALLMDNAAISSLFSKAVSSRSPFTADLNYIIAQVLSSKFVPFYFAFFIFSVSFFWYCLSPLYSLSPFILSVLSNAFRPLLSPCSSIGAVVLLPLLLHVSLFGYAKETLVQKETIGDTVKGISLLFSPFFLICRCYTVSSLSFCCYLRIRGTLKQFYSSSCSFLPICFLCPFCLLCPYAFS